MASVEKELFRTKKQQSTASSLAKLATSSRACLLVAAVVWLPQESDLQQKQRRKFNFKRDCSFFSSQTAVVDFTSIYLLGTQARATSSFAQGKGGRKIFPKTSNLATGKIRVSETVNIGPK